MIKRGLWLIISWMLLLPVCAFAADGKCSTCHAGIEKISDVQGMAHLTCTDCHMGNSAATGKNAAHQGIYVNPSDLRVIDKTCGSCHPREVENATKSLHATSAGKVSGTRYAWGAQGREGIYASMAVSDPDPKGQNAVASLKALPY